MRLLYLSVLCVCMCCIITKIDHLLHNVHVMFRGVSRISGRGCLRSGPIRKVGVGVHFRSDIRKLGGQSTSGPIYENWGGGGGGGQSTSGPIFEKCGGGRGGGNSLQVRYEKWGGGAVRFRSDIRKLGGGGGAVHFRSDIRKRGGGGGGGQSTSGPIYEKWGGGGGGGAIRFRSDTKIGIEKPCVDVTLWLFINIK